MAAGEAEAGTAGEQPAEEYPVADSSIRWARGAAVLKTRSAAAIAVMCLAVAVFALVTVRRRFRVALLGTVAAMWVFLLPRVSEFEPIDRLSAVVSGRGDPTLSWANRVRYWEGAVDVFGDRPLLGHGPGQVGLVYGPSRIQAAGFSPYGEVVADVHSLPFNWLLEYGGFGAAMRVSLCLALIVGSFTRVRDAGCKSNGERTGHRCQRADGLDSGRHLDQRNLQHWN